jgi:protein TonB
MPLKKMFPNRRLLVSIAMAGSLHCTLMSVLFYASAKEVIKLPRSEDLSIIVMIDGQYRPYSSITSAERI